MKFYWNKFRWNLSKTYLKFTHILHKIFQNISHKIYIFLKIFLAKNQFKFPKNLNIFWKIISSRIFSFSQNLTKNFSSISSNFKIFFENLQIFDKIYSNFCKCHSKFTKILLEYLMKFTKILKVYPNFTQNFKTLEPNKYLFS